MSKSRARFLSELLGTTGLVKKAKSALAGADEIIDLSALPSIPNSKLTNSSITINSSATSLGGSVTLTTANVAENTNLYYTDARADARIAAADTGDLSEGSNLYYTNARADARIAAATTDDLSEGSSNLYYTDARADARVALIVDSAPGTLNTLNELAAALGDDANFSTTVTNSIATKLPLAGGTITGTVVFNSAPTFNTAIAMGSTLNVATSIGIAGTTVIDSSRNLTNIGTISSGAITSSGNVTSPNLVATTATYSPIVYGGSSNLQLKSNTAEMFAQFVNNGAAELYYDNSAKLATATGGITVTGETNTTTLASGNSTMTGLVQIGNSSGGTLLFKRPSANYIFADQTGGYLAFGTNGRITSLANSNFYLATDQSSTFVGQANFSDSISSDGPITINGSGSEDRYLKFALDGRGSAFTGENAAFIFCGQGGSGDFLAGGLYLQSRSATAGREIGFITGTTPTKRMVIDSSGKVGIGTDSPGAVLEISGKDDSLGSTDLLRLQFDNSPADTGITFTDIFSTVKSRITLDSGNTNDLRISAGTKLHLYGGTTNGTTSPHLTVSNNGNVGIGTDDPTTKLHIMTASNGASTVGTASDELILENSSDCGLTIRSGSSYDGVISFADADDHNVGQVFYSHSSNSMTFRTNDSTAMTIDSAGTVDVSNDLLTNNAKLKAIAESNTDTAVDLFVYDTRKDSDGGAWRKRTQNTSWYNETLNQSHRGARKEFPCVAVIVAEATQLTIYDGDDPDMPMWMVFNSSGANGAAMLGRSTESTTSVSMLNGILSVGRSSFGLHIVHFISDFAEFKEDGYDTPYALPIGTNRNSGNSWVTVNRGNDLVNDTINDVAMTVLPNAPIDADTRLPVPTIAVATNGGVSVIKDDGTVVDITSTNSTYNYWDKVKFTKDNKLIIQANYQNVANQLTHIVDFPTGDVAANNVNAIYSALNGRYYHGDSCSPRLSISSFKPYVEPMQTDSIAVGHRQDHFGGINLIAEEPSTQSGTTSDSAMCYISSSRNTGWAVGDIKLATLSDTDTTNISASGNTNLLSGQWTNNGSFPYETFTTSGLDITSAINTTAYGAANKTWTATLGKTYTAYFNLTLNSGTAPTLYVQTSSSFGNGIAYQTVNGVNAFTFTATMSTSSYFSFSVSNGVATNFSVSNLELYEGGVTNHMTNPLVPNTYTGLSVFGTITKTAVATGAELVGYNASNTTSYLEQPYNSELDFGTAGDFHYSFWVYSDSSATYNAGTYIFERTSVGDPSSRRIEARLDTSTNLQVYATSAVFVTGSTALTVNTDSWNKVDIIRKSNEGSVWINGVQKVSGSHSGNMTDTSAKLTVCNRGYFSPHNQGFPTGIALFRVSATAPTEEQIKKMYNDEKHLFEPNAKATLYGTSDAVTALAYDDSTELLHVGTSAGRSEFQGLNRVNNTTDAVGTAISAGNGFIVEE